MDTSKLAYNDITVSNIATDITWNEDFTKVTITPSQGEWPENSSFTVSLDITSTDGDDLNTSVDFDTFGNLGTMGAITAAVVAAPDSVDFADITDDKVGITASDDYITLRWAPVEGASRYDIYFMNDDEETLTYQTNTTSTDYYTGIAHGDFEINDGPAFIQIWATNGEQVSKSAIIKLREE